MGVEIIARGFSNCSATFCPLQHAIEVTVAGVPTAGDIESLGVETAQFMRTHRVNAFLLDVRDLDRRFEPKLLSRGLLPLVRGYADARPGAVLATMAQSTVLRVVSRESAGHGALMPTFVSRERALVFLAEEVVLWATDCRRWNWSHIPPAPEGTIAAARRPADAAPDRGSNRGGLTARPPLA